MEQPIEQPKPAVRSSKLVAAGDALADAVKALESRIGCGCGGDYGTCNYCERAAAEAERAAGAWDAEKKAAGCLMPDLLQLDNDSKIKFCNAWHAMARHYTVCKQCQVYLIEGDDDLCAIGKHLVAKELCYAECRVEITPNDPSSATGLGNNQPTETKA